MKAQLEKRMSTLDKLRQELWDAHQDVKNEISAVSHDLSAIYFREQKSKKRERMVEILQLKSSGMTDEQIGCKIGIGKVRVGQIRRVAERLNSDFKL